MRGPRLLLVLLLLTAFTLTVLDVRAQPFGALRQGADAVLGPAQRAVGGAARSVGGVFDDSGEQVQQLERENAELRAQLRTSDDLRRRVDELDALLRLKDAGGYTVVPARVSALGSTLGFAWTVTIDVGSDDGVRAGGEHLPLLQPPDVRVLHGPPPDPLPAERTRPGSAPERLGTSKPLLPTARGQGRHSAWRAGPGAAGRPAGGTGGAPVKVQERARCRAVWPRSGAGTWGAPHHGREGAAPWLCT